MVFSLCKCIPNISLYNGLRSTLIVSFELNHLFKGLASKYSHILRYKELGIHRMNFYGKEYIPQQLDSKNMNLGIDLKDFNVYVYVRITQS
jgi:hypothetical protein